MGNERMLINIYLLTDWWVIKICETERANKRALDYSSFDSGGFNIANYGAFGLVNEFAGFWGWLDFVVGVAFEILGEVCVEVLPSFFPVLQPPRVG